MGSQSTGFEEIVHGNQNSVLNLIDGEDKMELRNPYFLERFYLFKTRSNFYLVGRDISKNFWRVLKIDRSEPSELVLYEDPTEYSRSQCNHLLQRIHDGNRHVGGRKFVSTCYGIIGFIKFLAPYYMVLITKRRQLGEICGHPIYGISKYTVVQVPHKSVRIKARSLKDENRYKKLLHTVDLTKDFYFSYSYPLMHTLQRNLCRDDTALMSYGSNFVWNEYMTQEIRKQLRNTLWTVALVHGFFKQAELSRSGCNFWLTLLARRSRLNAGTRYLKRGVNEKGEVANDVEIEQIVCQRICDGVPYRITSIIQNRGSIPLFWFQPTSWLNIKPDILLLRMEGNYEATKLHFEALTERYGNPIVILNLVKSHESKPRESILSREFEEAVTLINTSSAREERLEFQSLDLNGHFKVEGASVLNRLGKMAKEALDRIRFFSYEVAPYGEFYDNEYNSGTSRECTISNNVCIHHSAAPGSVQNGIVRTNCIDCIDRTNVAQYVQGLVALNLQLHALGILQLSEIDSEDEALTYKLMEVYKLMGDALAWQYGGSASRCKVFSVKRREWKPAAQLREMIKTVQRYWSNVYVDIKKQKGIDLFLGYFQPGFDELEMIEGLVASYQNPSCRLSRSSLGSQADQRSCFLCEGMSYRRTPGRRNSEVTLGPFTVKTQSQEAFRSADTSRSDLLGDRHSSVLSETQYQALTDIKEGLWFGNYPRIFRDEASDKCDIESLSSSAYSF